MRPTRSNATPNLAAGRGALLLAIAAALGILLLKNFDTPVATNLVTNPDDDADPIGNDDDGGDPAVTSPGPSTTVLPPARQPAEVKVLAANASGVNRAAGKVSDTLRPAGYNILAPTTASVKDLATSSVYFVPGYERDAQGVATLLALPVSAVKAMPAELPVANTAGVQVLVLVGKDLANRPASTSTTARPASGGTATTRPAGATTTTTR